MMKRSRFVVAACVLAIAGFVVSCAGPPPPDTGTPVQSSVTSTPETDGTSATKLSVTTKLSDTRTDELGNIVADQDGRTLYRFEKDTTEPPASNCSGQCAVTWPPALVGSDSVELTGIDSALVGTIQRSDGAKQLTLAGRPLYRYEKDKAPGETKGQGVGGTWFAVTSTGQKAAKAALVGASLVAARSDNLGAIVLDADGYTMYRFDKDTANPSQSNCSGECAKTWPPAIITTDEIVVDGIDRNLVSTITRADGAKQLTIAGWPVYGFSKDKVAGDINGQGVGGTWFAIAPTGRKAAP